MGMIETEDRVRRLCFLFSNTWNPERLTFCHSEKLLPKGSPKWPISYFSPTQYFSISGESSQLTRGIHRWGWCWPHLVATELPGSPSCVGVASESELVEPKTHHGGMWGHWGWASEGLHPEMWLSVSDGGFCGYAGMQAPERVCLCVGQSPCGMHTFACGVCVSVCGVYLSVMYIRVYVLINQLEECPSLLLLTTVSSSLKDLHGMAALLIDKYCFLPHFPFGKQYLSSPQVEQSIASTKHDGNISI